MDVVWILIGISECVSLFLVFRVWRNRHTLVVKLLYTVGIFVPFIGPLMFLWIYYAPAPQAPELQNNMTRGDYTHRELSNRRDLDKHNKV